VTVGDALVTGAVIAVLTSAVIMVITTIVARAQGRVVVVDTAWGLDLFAIALVAAVMAVTSGDGDTWRSWLVTGAVGLWALRLAWHMHRRGDGTEDPRYEKLLGGPLGRVGLGVAVRKVFAVQGLAAAVVAMPVAAGVFSQVRWTWLVVVGLGVWAIGLFFETVGDAQLAAYRAQSRDERPQVLDSGLWRYTRHPNYFGDACVWWGLWLAAALSSGWALGAATVVAPVAMTYFLVRTTGAGLLEKTMMRRPGYPEYAERTSRFIPLPRRTRTTS